MNNEIQALLSTIDDHKKLNEKLNKHYKKRLADVEKDVTNLLKCDLTDMTYGLGTLHVKVKSFLEI